MKRPLQSQICLVLVLGAVWVPGALDECRGEVIAADHASNAAYSDGWQGLNASEPAELGMDNGGFGFLPWDFDETWWESLRSPYPTPHFLDTGPSNFNNLGAPAFAITNGNVPYLGYTTTATRPFAAPLRVGDQISVDIDNPVMQKLAEFDSAGFIVSLLTTNNVDRLAIYTTESFNKDEWTISDLRGDDTPSGFTDEAGSSGFKLTVKLTGEETYRMTITPRSGGAPIVVENQLAGTGKGEITKIRFLMFGNGSGDGRVFPTGEREFYFNNLQIESSGPSGFVQKPSDCNQDGTLDISDAVCTLFLLFQGGNLPCGSDLNSPGNSRLLDANGDARADLSDAVWILGYLFRGSAPPALGTSCQGIEGCPDNVAKCN